MKLWDNIRLLTRDKTPKFEHFWVYYKGERTIFLRGPKTYGSPYIHEIRNLRIRSDVHKWCVLSKMYDQVKIITYSIVKLLDCLFSSIATTCSCPKNHQRFFQNDFRHVLIPILVFNIRCRRLCFEKAIELLTFQI